MLPVITFTTQRWSSLLETPKHFSFREHPCNKACESKTTPQPTQFYTSSWNFPYGILINDFFFSPSKCKEHDVQNKVRMYCSDHPMPQNAIGSCSLKMSRLGRETDVLWSHLDQESQKSSCIQKHRPDPFSGSRSLADYFRPS